MIRKCILMVLLSGCHLIGAPTARAQDLQLHYDWRHSVDPRDNARNFPSVVFKSFKAMEFGSFLLKMQGELDGSQHNLSQMYFEVSQGLRFWKPPVHLHLEYSGGLGLFNGGQGGYYLPGAYLIGAAHPFPWKGGWGSAYLAYKRTSFRHPSNDPQLSFFWGRGFRRADFATTTVMWTENRNHGDAQTLMLTGKRYAALMENEVWYRCVQSLSVGSLIRVSRGVYTTEPRLLVYPTVGARYTF